MISYIQKHFWAFGLCIALVFSVLLAGLFSMWNWVENPGGIFHDSVRTNWGFVYDTAASWFVPIFLYTFGAASAMHLLKSQFRSLYDNRKSVSSRDVDNK